MRYKETPLRLKAFQGLQEILIRNIPLPQEAKQHVQDIVESPQQRHFVCVPSPTHSRFFVFFLSELARCHLPSCRCLLPLPFWVSIQLQLSSLNCGTHRKKHREKNKKRGNSLGCQVPIVGFTFGPDKLKCPRTIPGVDFLFMCPLALSRSPLSSAYLAVFLSVFTVFFFLLLFLPPVLRSCSASGKPLN